jgi:hypothetical protein
MKRWTTIAALLVVALLVLLLTGQCSYEAGRWLGAN